MAMTLLFVSPSVAALDKPPKHDCELVSSTSISTVIASADAAVSIALPACSKNSVKETATSYTALREGVGLYAGAIISNIDTFKKPSAGYSALYSLVRYRHAEYTLNSDEKPITYFAFPRSVRILIRHLASC